VVVTTDAQTYAAQFAPGTNKRRPTQVVEAQFSLPFLIATALTLGRVGIGDVARVDHAPVLALAARIEGTVREDAPAGWAQIRVQRIDGRSHTLATTTPSGSPEKPLSDAQLRAKFRDCAANAAHPIANEVIEQAMHLVFHLDAAPEATALVHLFAPRE
jgi:2-methylcitrate dehydratase PrpD